MSQNLTHLAPVFRRAAEIIHTNGHWQDDYLPDPFNRVRTDPHAERPMSMAAALWCAVTGSPRVPSTLANEAIRFLAARLLVDGEGPWNETRTKDCELHLSAWGDVPGRTAGEVVVELLRAAESVELAAAAPRLVVIPLSLATADGAAWELASVGADGEPHYVMAGVPVGSQVFAFASRDELVGRFGAVSGGAA